MDSPKDAIYSGPKVRNISLIEYTVESPHGFVYDLISIPGAFVGEMEIDHGGFQLTVAHVTLNQSGVGPGFQQMRGIGVAQEIQTFGFLALSKPK